jgi:hypothetical protein
VEEIIKNVRWKKFKVVDLYQKCFYTKQAAHDKHANKICPAISIYMFLRSMLLAPA